MPASPVFFVVLWMMLVACANSTPEAPAAGGEPQPAALEDIVIASVPLANDH